MAFVRFSDRSRRSLQRNTESRSLIAPKPHKAQANATSVRTPKTPHCLQHSHTSVRLPQVRLLTEERRKAEATKAALAAAAQKAQKLLEATHELAVLDKYDWLAMQADGHAFCCCASECSNPC